MKQIYLSFRSLIVLVVFLFSAIQVYSQSGFCYKDYNKNGIKDPRETGVSGISVKSFSVSGAILGTATTGNDGSYALLPAASSGQQVRVEFTIPATGSGCSPSNAQDYAGYKGSADGSSVKFVTGPVTNLYFYGKSIRSWWYCKG
jgi:hypothetical protein